MFCRGDFTPFMSKSFQIWDHFFPLPFPKDSEYLKSLDIGLREVGKKRPLIGVRKCDGQTDTHTHGHHPKGRCFENLFYHNIEHLCANFYVTFPYTSLCLHGSMAASSHNATHSFSQRQLNYLAMPPIQFYQLREGTKKMQPLNYFKC